jgi:hypothetical protein
MERDAASRRYESLHEERPFHDGSFKRWSKDLSPSTPYHFRDGVTIWVAATDVNPEDNFLNNATPTGGEHGGDTS